MSAVAANPGLIPPATAGPVSGPVLAPSPARAPDAPSPARGFGAILREQLTSVRFSQHALQRAERRGIELDPATLQRLDAGVARARDKGARDAVVLVDGTAFVVSVRNRTVITAVDQEHMREQVFTNIDSAVIA